MKKSTLILFWLFFSYSILTAQNYTAAGYWNMENDPSYVQLKERQAGGDTLSVDEQSYLLDFKTKLNAYFEKLSDEEKSLYYKYRSTWAKNPFEPEKAPLNQEQDVFSGEKSAYTQYLISSGVFGFIYGLTAVGIIEPEDEGVRVGIPLLSAGVATLIPVLTTKDRQVTYNSLKLSFHGKALGYAHGAALSLLIQGDEMENSKLLLTLGGLSSIAMGRVGYVLGRDKPWSAGRVALYSHYGILMPLEGVAVVAAFESDNARIYGATILASGAAGYLLADRIADWNDFTKGDVISTQAFTLLNAGLGLGIAADINYDDGELNGSDFLYPAIGALGGSIAGHYITKNTRLTKQQGRNTGLAAAGGVVVGLGMAALIQPDRPTLYYILPYISGMTTYGILVNKYRKSNYMAFTRAEGSSGWNISLTPYNIFLNKKIAAGILANPAKKSYLLPAFSASYSF